MKVITFKKETKSPLINKQMIENETTPPPSKFELEETDGEIIKPIMDPTAVKEMVNKSPTLADCIDTTAEDMILNDFDFSEDDEKTNEILSKNYNNNNKLELYDTARDYVQYGYGCAEIIYNKDGTFSRFAQIPADTCRAIKKERKGEKDKYDYYVAQFDRKDKNKKQYFRMSRFDYDDQDNEEYKEVIWFGRGPESQFYATPCFFSDYHYILLDVAISVLNSENVTGGNLLSGIFTISGKVEKDFEDKLDESITDTGVGILNLVIRTEDIEGKPAEVKFHKLDRDDGESLNKLQANAQKIIMQSFKMPPIRLGRMDDKDGMNTDKNKISWNIYTKTISKKQMAFEITIDEFNLNRLNVEATLDIITPIFIDEASTKIDNIYKGAHLGLISYEQANKGLATLMPEVEINLDEIASNPILKERYYKGQLLGAVEKEKEADTLNKLDDSLEEIDLLPNGDMNASVNI